MATQEIDISIQDDESGISVAAADNTLANDLSIHWNDAQDKMEIVDLLTKAFNAAIKHLSTVSMTPAP